MPIYYFCSMIQHDKLTDEAWRLLKALASVPRTSRNEKAAADLMEQTIGSYGLKPWRVANNVGVMPKDTDPNKPTLLLNAHIDTVKPVDSWTRNPFQPVEEDDGKLYGLGTNDCGGGLCSLLQVFRFLSERRQSYNLMFLASAEEEISGRNGIELALTKLPHISVAVVGEPTGMQPAVAERGLMVLDVVAHGKSGHAARNEGVNAIYEALPDVEWLRDYKFSRVSQLLGPVKMTVATIHAGTQHNVVPDRCEMLVDVRTNELYTLHEVFDIISSHLKSDVSAHSFRLNPSFIPTDHPLVRRCVEMGMKPYGSPTLSDQALMPFPSMKLGPGDSARSHTADEYITRKEVADGIDKYIALLDGIEL